MKRLQIRSAWRLWLMLSGLVVLGVVFALKSVAAPSAALDYPNRPITIVVTFPPGGGTDLLARHLGVRLEKALGVPVIVENRPGASGNIGARLVANASADGYTLLMVNSSFAINPGVYSKLDFSPTTDFAAVFNVAWVPSLVVTAPDAPLADLADMLHRANTDMIPVASCGNGTPQHLAVQMLHEATQGQFQHIPYRGCAPALADVSAGTVQAGIVTVSSAMPFVQSGRLRALAVTAAQRSVLMADVPTVADHGLEGYELDQWHGLLAPAGVPEEVLDRLEKTLNDIVQTDELRDVLYQAGYAPAQQTRHEFAALVAEDIARFGALTARMGLQVD